MYKNNHVRHQFLPAIMCNRKVCDHENYNIHCLKDDLSHINFLWQANLTTFPKGDQQALLWRFLCHCGF